MVGCGSGTGPGGDPEPGGPGAVTYRLVSPYSSDGGVLFTLPSAEVLSLSTVRSRVTLVTHESGAILSVAALDRFGTDELMFEVEVMDVNAPPEATLLSVVGPDNLLRPLSGHALEVVR